MTRRRKPPPPPPSRAIAPRRLTSRRLYALLGGVIAIAAAAVLTVVRPWGSNLRVSADAATRVPLPPPRIAFADTSGISHADFIGSERCASCHEAQFAAWMRSTHARAGGTPSEVAVVARFDGAPIRFRDAVVVPARSAKGYALTVRQEGRDPVTLQVDGVIGGGHMVGGGTQGFVSRMDDGTLRFLPFDFHRIQGEWFCNTAGRAGAGWIRITPSVALAECGDWPMARILGDDTRYPNCQSCHGSQIEVALDTVAGRYRTSLTSLSINCESCHGPGRRHVALVGDPSAVAAGEIGMRPLATLDKDGSLGTCWQCHALKERLRGGYLSGKPLAAYYALRTPQLGNRPHLADGRVRTFAYQEGHLWSDCYVNGGMTCTSCHDPHSQGYRDVSGTPLVGRFDDRQCTSCHRSKGAAPTLHTHHAPSSDGSRCTSCHMPYLQEPEVGTTLRYARSDHAIPSPRPLADSTLGVVSACQGCHADRSARTLDEQVAQWWGALKPRAKGIAKALALARITDRAAAARLVLDADEPHVASLFVAMSEFVERFLEPDDPRLEAVVIDRLEKLSTHPDLEVRSLALASLHYAGGTRVAVRRHLATQLASMGSDEPLVRVRWALVLAFLGERRRLSGDLTSAIATHRKAVEVEPGNARHHLDLGVALTQAGDFAAAIPALRASLERDTAHPLTWVNLGIALSSSGDKRGAIEAYRAALKLDARDALASFNLGNAHFELGEDDAAEAAYRAATRFDPSLPLAHFYLARALFKRGDLAGALRETEAGLEFDPANREALDVRERLRRAIAGATP